MRRVAFRLAAVLALVAMSAATGAAAAHRSVKSGPKPARVYAAHLRLHIATTSMSTSVSISPGTVAASRLRKSHGPGRWDASASTITLSGGTPAGRNSVTADLIYDNSTSYPRVSVGIDKGIDGAVHVRITRVVGTRSTAVRTVTDDSHSASSPNTAAADLARSKLMGRHALRLPRADARKLVLAFYYPWFHGYSDPTMADQPRHPRSTYSRRGVTSMTRQAKTHGIDGFIVSWAGSQSDGHQFRLALKAATRTHQLVTGYLESVMAASHSAGAEVAVHWLVRLLRYSHHHAFLKARDGVPVVFVYQMSQFTASQWHSIRHQLRHRYHQKVHLVGDTESPSYLRQEWGVHTYAATGPVAGLRDFSVANGTATKARAALHPHARRQLFAATVTPGYDDQRLRGNQDPVIPRDGGRRYRAAWRAALTGQPDWILVTSWNEWFEDTEVEPGKATGSQALTLTRREASRWQARRR